MPSKWSGREGTENRHGSGDICLESPHTFSHGLIGGRDNRQSGGDDAGQRHPREGLPGSRKKSRALGPETQGFPILWGLDPVCHFSGTCQPFSGPRPSLVQLQECPQHKGGRACVTMIKVSSQPPTPGCRRTQLPRTMSHCGFLA